MPDLELGPQVASLCQALEQGKLHPFADWPNAEARVAVGAYTIWEGAQFLYVGVSGRPSKAGGGGQGLFSRLNAHAGGRRSGDQFCVYVCDRLVLPALAVADLGLVASGRLRLDGRVRDYVRSRLGYRFVAVDDYSLALRVEAAVKRGALGAGKPLLNGA